MITFTSIYFFIFLIIVFLGAYILDKRARILFYTLMSYFFYVSFYPYYIFLLFGISILNYYLSKKLAGDGLSSEIKRFFLVLSLVINIGTLVVFKYISFIILNINKLFSFLHVNLCYQTFDILFPLGISFYIFIVMGYMIDIYRRQSMPAENLLDFCFLVSFFPHLLAGPILKAKEFLPQIKYAKSYDKTNTLKGIELIMLGYFKKVIIADNCAGHVNNIYLNPHINGGIAIWAATFLFAVQIYCDFSGYTDIARGIAKILGFKFPINFKYPYLSDSIQEFWRRWHITLSFWIRDYLYFPLGGSRVTQSRYILNMIITWFICGLWHGANYNFILWGLYNGILIVIHHYMNLYKLNRFLTKLPNLKILITFILVMFGWMIFRCNNISDIPIFIRAMFFLQPDKILSGAGLMLIVNIPKFFWVILLLSSIIHIIMYKKQYDLDNILILEKIPYYGRLLIYFCFFSMIFFNINSQTFIYFKF